MRIALLILTTAALAGLGALWIFATHEAPSLARPAVSPDGSAASRGAAAFEGGAFGGISLEALDSHAMPWHLISSALVMRARKQDPRLPANSETLNRTLAYFGFLTRGEPVNRPNDVAPVARDLPLGFTYADLAPVAGMKVRVANLGCPACHAGVAYDQTGNPKPDQVLLGMPNTSLNLEAYTVATYEAFKDAIAAPEKFWATVQALYPDLATREYLSLRYVIWPLVKKRLAALEGKARPLPFPNGRPGSTNGVAALKFMTNVELQDHGLAENGIVSVPDLGYRHLRTSLLVDGAYATPEHQPGVSTKPEEVTADRLQNLATITTFFTVPSMGVDPEGALSHLSDAADIFAFLADAYKPMKFPGKIDIHLAQAGERVFENTCASCHGTYSWNDGAPVLTSYPNWSGDVGTDTLRRDNFTPALADRLKKTRYGDLMQIAPGGDYVAPPLTGLWASAPFLHNGSVPTLEALLQPGRRPSRFLVGGHALDFEKVGLRLQHSGDYPPGYLPFSTPVLLDTSLPGLGNSGHTFGADLQSDDRKALLEYLKLL